MRSVLEPTAFAKLFTLLLETLEKSLYPKDNYELKLIEKPAFIYVLLKSPHKSLKDELNRALGKSSLDTATIANAHVQVYDLHYSGYIFRSDDFTKQQLFRETLQNAIANWEQKRIKTGVISSREKMYDKS